jgi:hypothetical protein
MKAFNLCVPLALLLGNAAWADAAAQNWKIVSLRVLKDSRDFGPLRFDRAFAPLCDVCLTGPC